MSQIHQVLLGPLPFAQYLGDGGEHFHSIDLGTVTHRAFQRSWRKIVIFGSCGSPERCGHRASVLQIIACLLHVRLLIDR